MKYIYTRKIISNEDYNEIEEGSIIYTVFLPLNFSIWNYEKIKNKKLIIKRIEDTLYPLLMEDSNDGALLPLIQKYKIAVPSYNRLNFFGETTYKYLMLNNINPEDIVIFVSTEKDLEEYSEIYNNVVLVPENYKGIGAVRNYILNIWAEDGSDLVMMDDDIKYIKNIKGEMVLDFKDFVEDFFMRLLAADLYFGGMCLCSNTFFMKDNYSTNLRYISGATQFYKVDRSREAIFTPYRHFEDYYSNLRHFKRDGGILRCNFMAPITKNYNPIGGICENMGGLEERLKEAEKNADEIIIEFPKWVSKYKKKKSSRGPECYNLRLNHRAKI